MHPKRLRRETLAGNFRHHATTLTTVGFALSYHNGSGRATQGRAVPRCQHCRLLPAEGHWHRRCETLVSNRPHTDIGIVLGLKGLAGYPLRGFYSHPTRFPGPKDFVRNCSAVSGGCMVVRKNVFEQVRGFGTTLTSASECGRPDIVLCGRQTPSCTTRSIRSDFR